MLDQSEIDAALAAAAQMPAEDAAQNDYEDEEPVAPPPPRAATAAAPAATVPVFAPLDEPETEFSGAIQNLDMVMDIPLEISVELGRKRMSIRQILDLGSGSIVELEKVAGEPVELLVNGRLVARGEVVVIEDNFGVRITEIVGTQARAAAAGGD